MSAWGMTENGAVTITMPGDPDAKVFGTDGCALPGLEVRVVGVDGNTCPRDIEGKLQVRGASCFVGYLKRSKLSKQYYPERLEIVQAMPRTPSGKIQKFKLREIAKEFGFGS